MDVSKVFDEIQARMMLRSQIHQNFNLICLPRKKEVKSAGGSKCKYKPSSIVYLDKLQ